MNDLLAIIKNTFQLYNMNNPALIKITEQKDQKAFYQVDINPNVPSNYRHKGTNYFKTHSSACLSDCRGQLEIPFIYRW